ncbi:MAG: hypothetical protein IPH03_07570 [Tetrasphaera sp.]|nr:hypothetical protein [Tetrasphaera sp.]
MTTRKTTSRTKRRSTGRSGSRATTRRRSGTAYRRRRTTPKVATTVGSAIGLLVVTALTRMSWPQRLGLVALVLLAGLAWVIWSHRAEIAHGASEQDAAPHGAGSGTVSPGGPAPAGAGPQDAPSVSPTTPIPATPIPPTPMPPMPPGPPPGA